MALIAARGGSRRLERKNLLPLGGKPLIVWSIDVVKDVPEVCDILVSTDDTEIADIARDAGALVPWLRPKKLATDTASSVDAALHALDWYEEVKGKIDGLLLLQPTSPFRKVGTVVRGLDLFRSSEFRPVVAVSPALSHPMWCFRMEGDTMRPFVAAGGLHLRSQDLEAAYVVNGAFYLIAPNDLRKEHSFFTDAVVPLIMHGPEESLDIDTEWDLRIARALASMV